METKLYANWWGLTLKGVLAVIFGIVAIFFTQSAILGLVLYFGLLAIFGGLFLIIGAFAHKKANPNWGWWLFEGLLDIIFGVMVLAFPAISVQILILFIGLWALFIGVAQIVSSFSVVKEGSGRWFVLINGLLSVIFGFLIVFNPFAGAIAITMIIGIFAVVYGIFAIMTSLQIKNLKSA